MYTVLLGDHVEVERDAVMAAMQSDGIETRPVFYPMHILPPYAESGGYPNADWCAARGLSLPSHGGLTDDDLDRVAASLARALEPRS